MQPKLRAMPTTHTPGSPVKERGQCDRAQGNSVGDFLRAEEEFEQKPAKHTKK
jgi:hypothetical protein